MDDKDKKPARNASHSDAGGEQIKGSERKISADNQKVEFKQEGEYLVEKKEMSAVERIVLHELRQEVEMMKLDESTKQEAEKKSEKIEFLGEKEKLEHLLQIVREKGVVFAIQEARKMNEPYLLDLLHDILAREGYYKDFTK